MWPWGRSGVVKASFPLEVAVEIIVKPMALDVEDVKGAQEMLRRWGSNTIQHACQFLPLIQVQGTTATKSQHIPYL